MTEGTADISAMSPEEATTALAELNSAFRGPPSENAHAQFKAKMGDKAFRESYLRGDGPAVREFTDLQARAMAEADPVEAALSNRLPDMPSSDLRLMANFADHLRASA